MMARPCSLRTHRRPPGSGSASDSLEPAPLCAAAADTATGTVGGGVVGGG
ncbi:MAG: hypothetical protein R3F11_27345 [Verrucomicrobiales bacterium]